MAEAVEKYSEKDLWRDDFSEMADSIHEYVVSTLQETGREFSYEALDSGRSEVEEGYSYSLEDASFDFSLAGTVNSKPEILEGSSRRAVFQVEEEEGWPVIREALENKIDAEITEKEIGPQTVYELKIGSPYRPGFN